MPLPGGIVQNPTFNPAVAVIIAIDSFEDITVIQTLNPHTFINGQSVKIIVPPAMRATMTQPEYDYGMPEINGKIAFLQAHAALPNLFIVDIDSRFFQPFTLPASPSQFAQAIPVGERNRQLFGSVRNVLGPPSPFGGENVSDN